MLRVAALVLALLGFPISTAAAQDAARAANAWRWRKRRRARRRSSLRRTAAKADEVAITYAGHSTYYIDTPGGVRIATDYSGAYPIGRLPDVVTMNRAHSRITRYFRIPRIPHVLHGWNDDGSPARINERIGDVLIRNVTTDIRRYFGDDSGGEMIKDGNSIFIFEVAGLCIGHLGHLHHQARRQPFRGDRPARHRDGADRRHLHHVAGRHLRNHAAPARLGRAADAPFRDPARRIHAPDRPAIRDRRRGPSAPCRYRGIPCRRRRPSSFFAASSTK